jgi:3-deoxy-D-manno-octulosonate 8-phosphate phosphatase (KDO 8-P phosphatase)
MSPRMEEQSLCLQKAKSVRCIVLDVDGVLTDGRIVIDGGGNEWKSFNVRDGLRIVMARKQGMKVAFLTGRESDAVSRRAAELSVDHVFQGVRDKSQAMDSLIETTSLGRASIAYLGDDLPDLPAMRAVGLAGAVGDAAPEVLEASDWRARAGGGCGAAGEFIEFILQSQGLWEKALREQGG